MVVDDPQLGMVFAVDVTRQSGVCEFVYDTPASKNGATSVGKYGKLSRPNPSTPNSGIRSSALATATLLPNNRSNTGQPVACACCDAPWTTHSLLENELYP